MKIETRSASGHSKENPVRMERQIRKNHIQKCNIIFSNGTTELFYVAAGHLLQKCDNSQKVVALPFEKNEPALGIFDALKLEMFPGVDWISPKNFESVTTINAVPCYKYHASGNPDFQAWIRTTDKYPVQVQIGQLVYRFSDIKPYPQNVDLPAAYQSAMAGAKAEQQAMDALRQLAK